MTERLYYKDAFLRDFDATIVEVADDGRRVYLDRTAFYPTSGGQPFDTGTLGGARVVDVIDEDQRIAHVLDQPVQRSTGTVSASVDWSRRFDHMQQHTGQHLLSAVLEDLHGWKTVSVHFGDATATLDVEADVASAAKLEAAEDRANALIAQNCAVSVSFEDAGQAQGLRKPTDRSGEIRVVSIQGVDRSACGGTHVRATGEIGGLLLRRSEKVKQGTRIEFVCGMRAVRRARADYHALQAVAGAVSSGVDEAAAVVMTRLEAARQVEAEGRRMLKELAAYRAHERYDSTEPDASGVRRVVELRGEGALDDLKVLAHAICALPRAAYIGAIVASGQVVVATSEDSELDAGRTLKAALGAANGRGGGSARIAQGGVARESLKVVVDAVLAAWDRGT